MTLYHGTYDAATGEATLHIPLRHDLSWLSKVAQSFRDLETIQGITTLPEAGRGNMGGES